MICNRLNIQVLLKKFNLFHDNKFKFNNTFFKFQLKTAIKSLNIKDAMELLCSIQFKKGGTGIIKFKTNATHYANIIAMEIIKLFLNNFEHNYNLFNK